MRRQPAREAHVAYTVCSRGRPIGSTDLEFVRIGGPHRTGFFHPNGEGERLVPLVAAPLPAMRDRMRRTARQGPERSEMSHEEATLLMAEIHEAGERERALGLTLHREDGSLVPTEYISFRDTAAYIEVGELMAECPEWHEDDDEIQRSVEHDLELLEESYDEEEDDDDGYPGFDLPEPDWLEDDDPEPAPWPRYQVQIELLDEEEIP